MQIDDSFRVSVPVDEAWRILLDLERVATRFPGVVLREVRGDEYHGGLDVEVGTVTAHYDGMAKLESVDDATHTAIVVVTGHDTRNEGDASATIKLSLVAEGDGTRVDVDTDLSVTGKVAQFGRDDMAGVSTRLLAEFAENLERDAVRPEVSVPDIVDLTEPTAGDATVSEAARGSEVLVDDPGEESDELVAEAVAAGAEPAASPSGNGAAVRKADQDETVSVDLLEPAGPTRLRRLAPILGLVAAALLARILIRRRRR